MKTFAVLQSGRVSQLIPELVEVEGTDGAVPLSDRFHPDFVAALVECGADVEVGWIYDGESFWPEQPSEAPVRVPAAISKRQAHRALLDAGLLDVAEAKIAAIEDPKERRIAQIEWDSQVYERSSEFLAGFAAELGLSEAQLDTLFIQAAEL